MTEPEVDLRLLCIRGCEKVRATAQVAIEELTQALLVNDDELIQSCLRKLASIGELARLRAGELTEYGKRRGFGRR